MFFWQDRYLVELTELTVHPYFFPHEESSPTWNASSGPGFFMLIKRAVNRTRQGGALAQGTKFQRVQKCLLLFLHLSCCCSCPRTSSLWVWWSLRPTPASRLAMATSQVDLSCFVLVAPANKMASSSSAHKLSCFSLSHFPNNDGVFFL